MRLRGTAELVRKIKVRAKNNAAQARHSRKERDACCSDTPPCLAEVGEFGLIERIAELVSRTAAGVGPEAGHVALGIGDDAALLEVPPERVLVATVDTLVEEVHFRRAWTGPEDLGWKSLAVNVSDVAAMGAEPLAAFLSLALSAETEVAWVEAFTRGFEDCAQEYGCALAGGDTVRSPQVLTITVTLLGTVERGRALLRSGAQVGDAVCVTGTLGDSAAGLALLQSGVQAFRRSGVQAGRGETPACEPLNTEHLNPFHSLLAAHHRPRPRLQAARALAASGCVTAMMDLSDGLASDIRHLAARSGAGARLRREALPLSDAVRAAASALGVDPTDWALHGGEDYELLFTLSPDSLAAARKLLDRLDVPMTVVGQIVAEGVRLTEPGGEEVALEPVGFAHFGVSDKGSPRRHGGTEGH
jgi:thiamine-monophosphate kinase